MDASLLKSPLPTDNLYKFMALFGTLFMGVTWWFSHQHANDFRQHSTKIASHFRAMANGIQSLGDLEKVLVRDSDGNVLAVQTLTNLNLQNPIQATPEDKEAFRRFMAMSDAMLFEWTKVPFDEQDKEAWFKMKDVAEHTKRRLGIDEEQYREYVRNLSMEDFRILRKPSNERAAELRAVLQAAEDELEEAWRLQALRERHEGLTFFGFYFGAVVAAIGYGCWYWRVQRLHDALLVKELAGHE